MCGRYSLAANSASLQARFDFEAKANQTPSYNIAPSHNALTLTLDQQGHRQADIMRWGLTPSWLNQNQRKDQLINARAETVQTKPSFKKLFSKQRCLVLADGFYEWQQTAHGKKPYHISLASGEPFAFAGIWDTCTRSYKEIRNFAIITVSPNNLVKNIHNRMPAILKPEDESLWLNSQDPTDNAADLRKVLRPYPAGLMVANEVSTKVNDRTNNRPELVSPI